MVYNIYVHKLHTTIKCPFNFIHKKKNFFSVRIFCTVKILEKFRPLLKTENSCQCLKDFKSSLNIQKKNLQK